MERDGSAAGSGAFPPATLQDPGQITGIVPLLVSLKHHCPEGFSHTDALPIVLKFVCVRGMVS